MSCANEDVRVSYGRSGTETVIYALYWPIRTPTPYVTSSACLGGTPRNDWTHGDKTAIGLRLAHGGDRKGRVLFYLEPGLGDSENAHAAALLHIPDTGNLQVTRLCYARGIGRYESLARTTLLRCAFEAALEMGHSGLDWHIPSHQRGALLHEQDNFEHIATNREVSILRRRAG